MSSKTKIVVLHMKEIIYTTIFIVLGILLLLSFLCFFLKRKRGALELSNINPAYTLPH